jgi:hypothetical protein
MISSSTTLENSPPNLVGSTLLIAPLVASATLPKFLIEHYESPLMVKILT